MKSSLPGMTIVTKEHPEKLILTYQVAFRVQTPDGATVMRMVKERHVGVHTDVVKQHADPRMLVLQGLQALERLLEDVKESSYWRRELQNVVDKIRTDQHITVRTQVLPTF